MQRLSRTSVLSSGLRLRGRIPCRLSHSNHLPEVSRKRSLRTIQHSGPFLWRLFTTETSNSDQTETLSTAEEPISAEPFFKSHQLPPNQILNQHYKSEVASFSSISSLSKTSSALLDGRLWWTASFVCPISRNTYEAGRLRLTQWEEVDGRIFYARKRVAVNAVAAAAVDSIEFEKTGTREPRLCEEDPIVVISSSEEIEKTATTPANDGADTEIQPPDITKLPPSEPADDEELLIKIIPKSGGPRPLGFETLSDRRLPATGSLIDPREDLVAAIRMTKLWLERHEYSYDTDEKYVHRVFLPPQDSPVLLESAKGVLQALSHAYQGVPFTQAISGSETLAGKVLHVLRKSKNTNADVECYNLYLRCLEAANPLLVARKAQKFVEQMNQQRHWRGSRLPKPNHDTMNILIQLWAQVGGTSGRFENTNPSFKPTKESFLAVLSSAAYPPSVEGERGGFDAGFAKQCIDRLLELYGEDSICPIGVDIWNAPLPWNGGGYWKMSRPYARATDWDNHELMFENGFRSEESRKEELATASSMADWVKTMETSQDVKPNIETYEALIQAWVRTCTMSGLEKAEEIAVDLLGDLSHPLFPRLQTFHPIIAAWLYSNDTEGLQKVDKWIDRLFDAGNLCPTLYPDSRVVLAYMRAQTLMQSTRISGANDATLNGDFKNEMLAVAESCSRKLHLSVKIFQDTPARHGMKEALFVNNIKAWHNAAGVCITVGDSDSLSLCLKEMVMYVNLFDDMVTSTLRREFYSGAGLRPRKDPSDEVLGLLANAHRIYFSYTLAVRELSTRSKGGILRRTIVPMEQMLRWSLELKEIESAWVSESLGNSNHDTNPCSGPTEWDHLQSSFDMYSYRKTRTPEPVPSHEAYIWQIVDCLGSASTVEVDAVDLVRIFGLLKQVSSGRKLTGKLTDAIDLHYETAQLLDKDLRKNPSHHSSISKKMKESPPRASGRILHKMRQLIPKAERQNRRKKGRTRSRKVVAATTD